MGKEKVIFKSMLVTKDGNYHKSYHLTINLKIRRRGRPPLPLSTLFFLPSRTTYLMGSFLKEELSDEF